MRQGKLAESRYFLKVVNGAWKSKELLIKANALSSFTDQATTRKFLLSESV